MKQLAVIISRSPGQNPQKREMEEDLFAAIGREPDVVAAIVPHLYDLRETDAAVAALRSVTGPLVVIAWLYPRAIHWTLDKMGIKGQRGEMQPRSTDADNEQQKSHANAKNAPARTVWSLDFRVNDTATHIGEIQRILRDLRAASPSAGTTASFESLSAFSLPPSETPLPRWYPVIDFGRCNDCMECLDFCLFGVYGVDDDGHVVVESPNNCKRGCPACSRVCPQNAILFPMHRTPAIAGAPGAGMDVQKLDLSELFGAPSAVQLATAERNAALGGAKQDTKPKDSLDKLMDALDNAKL